MSVLVSKDSEPRTSQELKRGQKLRLSCNECNKAKVKCAKEKPTCSRCKAQKIQCVYGVSLRAGKRAAAQGLNRAHPQPQSLNAVTNENHVGVKLAADTCSNDIAPGGLRSSRPQEDITDDLLHSFMYSGDPSGVLDYRGFDTYSTSLQQQTMQPYNMDLLPTNTVQRMSDQLQEWTEHDWLASNNQTPNFMASPALQIFDWDSTSNTASTPVTPSLTCSPAGFSSPSSSVSSEGSYQTTPSSMSAYRSTFCPSDLGLCVDPQPSIQPSAVSWLPNFKRSKCQCQLAILSLQKTLLRTSNLKSTSFDVALAANEEIVRRCTILIECECFPNDDSNVMVLSSIIARMISILWARASVPGTPSNTDAFASLGGTANRLADGTKEGSLTLGAYHNNKANGERLKMELVLIELEKLEKLVQEFQKGCYKNGCVASDFEDGESKTQDPRTFLWRSLFEFLTQKVRSASTNLRSKVLAGEDSHWC